MWKSEALACRITWLNSLEIILRPKPLPKLNIGSVPDTETKTWFWLQTNFNWVESRDSTSKSLRFSQMVTTLNHHHLLSQFHLDVCTVLLLEFYLLAGLVCHNLKNSQIWYKKAFSIKHPLYVWFPELNCIYLYVSAL